MAVTEAKETPPARPDVVGDKNNGGSNPKKNPKSRKPPPPPQSPPEVATDPPLECTRAEFDALLRDAAGLADADEAAAELRDCARHGEVDACRALLDAWSAEAALADARDAARSTPLHKACANGHASTVRLLLSRGARHLPNDSGNTPLHWAAGGGHAACVKLLLDHYDALALRDGGVAGDDGAARPADVLRKNDFGRSALTEGFAKGDAATVNHLLNHDSAEEEKLIGGLDKEDVEDEGEANEAAAGDGGEKGDGEKKRKKEGIVHEFDFLRGSTDSDIGDDAEERPSVLIRELVSATTQYCNGTILATSLMLPRQTITAHHSPRRSFRASPDRRHHRPRHLVRLPRHGAMAGLPFHGATADGQGRVGTGRGVRYPLPGRGRLRTAEVRDHYRFEPGDGGQCTAQYRDQQMPRDDGPRHRLGGRGHVPPRHAGLRPLLGLHLPEGHRPAAQAGGHGAPRPGPRRLPLRGAGGRPGRPAGVHRRDEGRRIYVRAGGGGARGIQGESVAERRRGGLLPALPRAGEHDVRVVRVSEVLRRDVPGS